MRKPRGTEDGAAPGVHPPDQVRNVALVGPSGAGKTTLMEALLHAAGAVPRAGRVEDGTTVSDSDELEQRRQHSVSLSVASVEHDGVKVTLLDTPGSADFVGELRAGLRAADAVLFVVSAAAGLDAPTVQLWAECAAADLPRAVVVTQLDRPRADVDETVAQCRQLLDDEVLPLQLLVPDADGQVGLLDLLADQLVGASAGSSAAVDDGRRGPMRAQLLEAVIAESEDETLLDLYLQGEQLDLDVLTSDLEKAVAHGHFHPAVAVAPLRGLGVPELLDLLVRAFPSPLEHPCPRVSRPDGTPAPAIRCDPDGPLLAEVVKTTTDPFLGRVSCVRVFSGTLRPDTTVHVSGHWGRADHVEHDTEERVGPLTSPFGSAQRPSASCPAGDVCTVARLGTAETGDTLSDRGSPLLVPPWVLPDPQLPVAIEAVSRADEDRLGVALARVVAEDPTVRVDRRSETGQQVLWCMGPEHAEVLLDRLRVRHGIDLTTPDVEVALRETLAGPARVTGRHVKQSGGHGQYAVVVLEVEPGPSGSGVVFGQRVVGGAVPSTFHGSVEKGVRTQAATGVSPTGPLVDVSVVLVDGKAHSVDSSDAAFQAAGALALREAAAAAGILTLEPWWEVEVRVPSTFVGPVLSDLAGRRARVTGSGTDLDDERISVVRAELPEAELLSYGPALRGVSHGTGSCTRRPLSYEPTLSSSRA